MAGKKKKPGAASAGRIIGGIVILYMAVAGARGVFNVDRSHAVGLIVTVMGIPVCIFFFLLGFAMITAGFTGEGKKGRKVSPDKLGRKEKQ